MKVTVRDNQSGIKLPIPNNCRILLNGVDVTARCHTADEESGMVWYNKLNAEGQPYVENNAVAEETLCGKVEIFL